MVKEFTHDGFGVELAASSAGSSKKAEFDRRKLLMGTLGGAIAIGGVGMGVKFGMDKSVESRYIPIDYKTASPNERAEAVAMLEIPDLQKYNVNPSIHPRKFIGKTPEQLRLGAPVPQNDLTESDEGFVEYLIYTSMAENTNYGWSIENLVDAAEQGYPIGQGGTSAYRDYLTNFMRSRLDGLFEYEYQNSAGISNAERLGDFYLNISERFENVIGNGGLGNIRGPELSLTGFSPLGLSEFDRSLRIDYSVSAPAITDVLRLDGAKGGYANMITDVSCFIGANRGADGNYEMGLLDVFGESRD